MVSYVFLGVLVTGLVQWLKNKYKTSKSGTLMIVAGLSIAFGVILKLLEWYNLMESVLSILAASTAVYAFIVQHFESAEGEARLDPMDEAY